MLKKSVQDLSIALLIFSVLRLQSVVLRLIFAIFLKIVTGSMLLAPKISVMISPILSNVPQLNISVELRVAKLHKALETVTSLAPVPILVELALLELS
jgi:hypothetical protein